MSARAGQLGEAAGERGSYCGRSCRARFCEFRRRRAASLTNPAFPITFPIATTPDRGFGVGHTRDTQTKGVWVWGETREVADEGGRGNRTVRVAMVMGGGR